MGEMRKKAKKAAPDPRRFLLEQIEKSGCLRMLHAKFLTTLLTEISNSELKRILPSPHTSSGIADDIAATLVIKYLEKHHLLNSITALNIESQESIRATHSTHALHFTSRHKSLIQLIRSRRAHIQSDYTHIKTGIAMKLLELAGDKICTQAVRSHLVETVQKSMDKAAHPTSTPSVETPKKSSPRRKSNGRLTVKSKSKSKPKPVDPSTQCKWKWVNSLDLDDELSGVDFNEHIPQLSPIKGPVAQQPKNDTKELLEEESDFSSGDFSPPPTPFRKDPEEVFIMKEQNECGPGEGFVITKLQ